MHRQAPAHVVRGEDQVAGLVEREVARTWRACRARAAEATHGVTLEGPRRDLTLGLLVHDAEHTGGR
jgi:hypothetical protein